MDCPAAALGNRRSTMTTNERPVMLPQLPPFPSIPGVALRHIAGSPGYCVGDDGFVRSCRSKKSLPGHRGFTSVIGHEWLPLRSRPNSKSGHLKVDLTKAKMNQLVHRLVATAFLGPCPKGLECCHEDGDPKNNKLTNLRWDTKKANGQDASRHGRTMRGSRNTKAKLDDSAILEIRSRLRAGHGLRQIAAHFSVSRSNIAFIRDGKTWRHVGQAVPA